MSPAASPASTSKSSSQSASASEPSEIFLMHSPHILPMIPSPKERVAGDFDTPSPSLSSLSSSSSVTQPTTPVHSSATVLTSTSPSSITSIGPQESPSKDNSNRKLCTPSTPSERMNANTTIHVRQQVSQRPSSQSTGVVATDSSTDRQPDSPSKPQTDLSPRSPQAVMAACSTKTPNPLQTTNVYINGLPPNFKAEQLYALTSQFGTVLSCRTFTRQLSDHPSGYGFVLFDSLEAAQQCIDVLRSHHNLHPTFAKQAHKINRATTESTVTSPTSTDSPTTQPPLTNVQPNKESTVAPITPVSIDSTSPGTDIYIEGLPMNVDVATLRVLLTPHTIQSSRFFADTRIHPPQLVALVRLESQAAARDIRSKLHGRTIRGYSDRLQVFSESEFALQLASTQSTSPQIGTTYGPTVASGLPMNTQDLFTNSDDPFLSLRGDKAMPQFVSPPLGSRFDRQSILSPDSPHLQAAAALQQQVSRQNSKLPLNQLCIPPQLQPLNATLNGLQAQLDSLRPLLYAFNQSIAAPNPFAMTSSTLTNTHQRSNSFGDNLAFDTFGMQPQSASTVLRSPGAAATIVANGSKQTSGSQLNPLAHTYPTSGNANGLSCLQSVTLGNYDTPSGLGLGAPLFNHSGNSNTTSAAARQANNHCNSTRGNHKAGPSLTVSSGSGGRFAI